MQLNEEGLKAVRDVSSRLDVLIIAEEVRQERQLLLDGRTNAAEYHEAKRVVDYVLADAEVVLCSYLPDRLFERAPKLRWVQCSAAGIDQWITSEDLARQITFTNARGAGAVPMAEAVLAFILGLAKNFPESFRLQSRHEWDQAGYGPRALRGRLLALSALGLSELK